MKYRVILQTTLFIAALTLNGAAQSGRLKKSDAEDGKRLNSVVSPADAGVAASNLTAADRTRLKVELENGIELYFAGEYVPAGEIFIKVIEADTRNRRAWFYLGLVYARISRTEDSDRAFAIAEKLPLVKLGNPKETTALQIIYLPQPDYTERVRREFVSGTVRLAVEFGADGTIALAVPITKFDPRLTFKAIEAALKIKFKPAEANGKPIATVKALEYQFQGF